MQEVAQLSQFDEELYKVCTFKNVHACGNLAGTKLVRGVKQLFNRLHTHWLVNQ